MIATLQMLLFGSRLALLTCLPVVQFAVPICCLVAAPLVFNAGMYILISASMPAPSGGLLGSSLRG
jgi:hypothetical protein